MDMPGSEVLVRLRFGQTPRNFDLEALSAAMVYTEYTFTAVNSITLQVVPRPFLSGVLPLSIFNLATFKELSVTGERFVNAGGSLRCRLFGAEPAAANYTRTAIWLSSDQITCPVTLPAVLSRANTLDLSISNDGGVTWSENSLVIYIPSDLPRITSLTLPHLIFTNVTTDLVFDGASLSALGASVLLGVMETNAGGSIDKVVKENITCYSASSGTSLACPGVVMPSCS
jgi:hypothetical protein